MSDDSNKKLKENIRNTRIVAGAGNQVAQNAGMIDPNTAQTVSTLAGNPGNFGAMMVQTISGIMTFFLALFTGFFAFLLKGLLIVKGIVLLPFIWPFLLIGAVFLFFKKIFD